jgi:chromosome segregation ATPase
MDLATFFGFLGSGALATVLVKVLDLRAQKEREQKSDVASLVATVREMLTDERTTTERARAAHSEALDRIQRLETELGRYIREHASLLGKIDALEEEVKILRGSVIKTTLSFPPKEGA